jgi:hypothetical protein
LSVEEKKNVFVVGLVVRVPWRSPRISTRVLTGKSP